MFFVDVPRLCNKADRKIRAAFNLGLEEGCHLRTRPGYASDFELLVRRLEYNISERIRDWREKIG